MYFILEPRFQEANGDCRRLQTTRPFRNSCTSGSAYLRSDWCRRFTNRFPRLPAAAEALLDIGSPIAVEAVRHADGKMHDSNGITGEVLGGNDN